MWAQLKNAVAGLTEQLGIEVPELPVDLGAVTDVLGTAGADVAGSVTDAAGSVTDAATGLAEEVGVPLPGGTEVPK